MRQKIFGPNEYGVVVGNRGNPYSGDVAVPSKWVVDGKTIPVRKIASYAFMDATALTLVVFPDSVTEISGTAFSGCPLFASVEIGRSVTVICPTVFDERLVRLLPLAEQRRKGRKGRKGQ